MALSFKHRIAVWAWNAFSVFLSGVAGGGLSILGAESANYISPNTVAHFTPHQFLTVCLSSGAVAFFMFVRSPAGKLPSIEPEGGSTPVPEPLPTSTLRG